LDYLRKVKGEAGAALIVAPLSVLDDTWLRTVKETLPWASAAVVHGPVERRRQILKAGHDYLIINYEGLHLLKAELMVMALERRLGFVVFDELTHYGNPDSRRWKAANAIVNESDTNKNLRVWGLTGTPGGNSVAVFGYVKLVNPLEMEHRSQSSWRSFVQERYGLQAGEWRDRSDAQYSIYSVMQPAIRFTKEQVLEHLPPLMRVYRRVELSKPQAQAIAQLREEYQIKFKNGETLTIQQQSALVGKVFQLALGVAIGDRGTFRLDSKPRIEEVLNIIKESDRKTVVFRAFTGALDDLLEQLRKAGVSVEKVDGSVGRTDRVRIFSDFQNKPEPRVLVAHPQTVAYGVELAAADQLIFDGPPLSGVQNYLQALERPMSAKQTADKVSVIQLSATDEERKFFENLEKRQSSAEMTADLFNFFLKGK
jgi:SNF2 family DNA or RNA helicase